MNMLCAIMFTFVAAGHVSAQKSNCASAVLKCTNPTDCSALTTYISCMTNGYSQCGGLPVGTTQAFDQLHSSIGCHGTSGNGQSSGNCAIAASKCQIPTDCSSLNAYIDCYTKACGGISQMQSYVDGIKSTLKCVGSNVMPSSLMIVVVGLIFFLTRLDV